MHGIRMITPKGVKLSDDKCSYNVLSYTDLKTTSYDPEYYNLILKCVRPWCPSMFWAILFFSSITSCAFRSHQGIHIANCTVQEQESWHFQNHDDSQLRGIFIASAPITEITAGRGTIIEIYNITSESPKKLQNTYLRDKVLSRRKRTID